MKRIEKKVKNKIRIIRFRLSIQYILTKYGKLEADNDRVFTIFLHLRTDQLFSKSD